MVRRGNGDAAAGAAHLGTTPTTTASVPGPSWCYRGEQATWSTCAIEVEGLRPDCKGGGLGLELVFGGISGQEVKAAPRPHHVSTQSLTPKPKTLTLNPKR